MKNTKRKAIAFISVFMLIIFSLGVYFLYTEIKNNPKYYTDEQHLQKITELVEKRYINSKYNATSFKLFPLYDADDKISYYLVDFEPYGWVYINIHNPRFINKLTGVKMYAVNNTTDIETHFQRYKICIDGVEPPPYNELYWRARENSSDSNYRWEINEYGEFVTQTVNHYELAGVIEQKKYFLEITQAGYTSYIPAVKSGARYLNLISMEEMDFEREIGVDKYSVSYYSFMKHKVFYNL